MISTLEAKAFNYKGFYHNEASGGLFEAAFRLQVAEFHPEASVEKRKGCKCHEFHVHTPRFGWTAVALHNINRGFPSCEIEVRRPSEWCDSLAAMPGEVPDLVGWAVMKAFEGVPLSMPPQPRRNPINLGTDAWLTRASAVADRFEADPRTFHRRLWGQVHTRSQLLGFRPFRDNIPTGPSTAFVFDDPAFWTLVRDASRAMSLAEYFAGKGFPGVAAIVSAGGPAAKGLLPALRFCPAAFR